MQSEEHSSSEKCFHNGQMLLTASVVLSARTDVKVTCNPWVETIVQRVETHFNAQKEKIQAMFAFLKIIVTVLLLVEFLP